MKCRICGASVHAQFRHLLLEKHEVQYFQCDACGLLQTEDPYWLAEAYEHAIATRDTGLVTRNLQLADMSACILWRLYGRRGKFLDAGGGYGLFTRLMRDIGFDYYWWDEHAENLLARGFEGSPQSGPYLAVSAFEVLEHLSDPVGWLRNLREQTGCSTFITSTELFSGPPPAPDQWWYYAFDTGQHITFFCRSALQALADKLGLRLYSHRHLHIFTCERLSSLQFALMSRRRWSRLLSKVPKARLSSRVWPDSVLLSRTPS